MSRIGETVQDEKKAIAPSASNDLLAAADVIDAHVRQEKHEAWINEYVSIDDLPFTPAQKEVALEWLAWQLSKILYGVSGEDFCGKTYDPLFIQGDTAHSYAFDLWDGGRHHKFETLKQVEDGLVKETIERLQGEIRAKIVGG